MTDEPTQAQVTSTRPRVIGGRYRLEDELGTGGMGRVYRALDLELQDQIAIKLLKREITPEDLERLRREVRLARKVTHRNVARIHDIGEQDGRWFLTMQLVEGATLRAQLEERKTFPRAQAYELVAEICEGIAAAHAVGVLHLDLKPENIMRPAGGGVVILDFGIARRIGEVPDPSTSSGTPAYMAPEQRVAHACDVRTDLYAVGVLLYELIIGVRPGDPGAPPIDELEGTTDAEVLLLERLLAFAPGDRPASAREVIDALNRLLGVATARSANLARRASRLRLGVLPFRSSSPEHAEVASGITEELADRLTSLRDATVLSTSATAKLAGTDPIEAATTIGVDSVIEGIVKCVGDNLHVTARLIDGTTGDITWSERFETTAAEVLSLRDRLAGRIAEALRVELGTLPFRGSAPRTAIELYMRSRGKLTRLELEGPFGAIADLARACDLAPDFAPAVALHALVCVRAWFFTTEDPQGARRRALAAIGRATTEAPDYPDTHLATGVLAFQGGDVADAVEHFERALDLAPSHPLALEYSGRLLCEAGHATEGFRRIELACSLDPKLGSGLLDIARHFALCRDWPEYDAAIERVVHRGFVNHGLRILQLRVAAWRRSRDVERFANELVLHHSDRPVLVAFAGALLGTLGAEDLDEAVGKALTQQVSRRFASVIHQFATEAMVARGDQLRAQRHLDHAASTGLIDLEWVDLCPALAPLRALDGFEKVRRRVRTRVASLWR